jgi:hypothetical protein
MGGIRYFGFSAAASSLARSLPMRLIRSLVLGRDPGSPDVGSAGAGCLTATGAAAPEYWWAYALLLSTTIPSLVNLAIGGMALTRGIPWLARLLLQWIPEGKASR